MPGSKAYVPLVQNPTQRLHREEVVPRVRYRIQEDGWERVAEAPDRVQYYQSGTTDPAA